MATQEQLEAALRNAAARARAGDERAAMAARRFAAELKAMRGSEQPAQPKTVEELTPGLSTNAAQSMTFGQQAAAAAGKSVRDTFYGTVQSMGDGGTVGAAIRSGLDAVGITPPESPLSRWAKDKLAETEQADQQLMGTGGGLTGNLGGQVLQMAVPGAGLTRAGMIAGNAPRLALAGGEAGAFANLQPVESDAGRLASVAGATAAGAVGQKLGDAAGAVISRAAAPIAEETANLIARARAAGIKIGVPELTNNRGVQLITDQLSRLPLAGARRRAEENVEAFNRAVSRTFGEDSTGIDSATFAAAKERIGNVFNALSEKARLPATPQFVQSLSAISDEARRFATGDTGQKVANRIEDLISKADADGFIPGRAYQSFDSELGKLSKAGGEMGFYIGKLRDAVRSAMDETIEGVDRQAWNEARRQYANLMTIAPLVAKEAGKGISPAELMGRVTSDKAGKMRMASGRGGELGELAQIGKRFMRNPPDSGTADRLLVNLGVLGSVGGAQQMGVIDPATAALLGGGLLANRGILRLLGSNTAGRVSTAQLPAPAASALARLVQATPYATGAMAASGIARLFNQSQAKEQEEKQRREGR